jgi:muramoyltetrapeptide carboxypeptidase
MLKPRALQSGDRVAVIAPASSFDRSAFDEGIAELARLGFEPVFDQSVFACRAYLAGDGASRAGAFLRAWRDRTVAGVIAARGGYGSVHLLSWLTPAELRTSPKAFIGYSDLTSVLTHLTVNCGIVGFHGPMVAGPLSHRDAGYDRRSFMDSLTRPEPLGDLCPPGLAVIKRGTAEGPLFGGTLTQLAASLGTPYAFGPPDGHVLFLEDVNERPYRVDRMMTQLQLSGVLGAASAIVLGEFPKCDEPGGGPTVRDTLAALLEDFPGPVLFGFPSGHTSGPAFTLPFGVRARVVAEAEPRLVIEEAAVV